MTWGARLGRLDFLRQRGDPWVAVIRRWLLVGAGASTFGKFILDFDRLWSILALVVVPPMVEAAGLVLGVWMARKGIVQGSYAAARDLDPYRAEHLALLREIRDRLKGEQ